MSTLTGASTRTITGYLVTLLEYPRWLIDRDVDFSECHLHGDFDGNDAVCISCEFGRACRWLRKNQGEPSLSTPLSELVAALQTAADYVRRDHGAGGQHDRYCDCDTCVWLREASNFLRSHRHRV
jgi:hypothetical protein